MIIRVKKESRYAVVDKVFVDDHRLSWRAKGILLYLLSKPDDWLVIEGDIVEHAQEGRDAVRRAMRELVALGYLRKGQPRGERSRFSRTEYEVVERPDERGEALLVNQYLVVCDPPSTVIQSTVGSKQPSPFREMVRSLERLKAEGE